MVHHRQRLSLGLETSDNGLGVHPEFDDLERNATPHRHGLFRDIDHAVTAFADSFQQFVTTQSLPHRFVLGVGQIELQRRLDGGRGDRPQFVRLVVGSQQRVEAPAQCVVIAAFAIQPHRALGSGFRQRERKQRFLSLLG
jgi:hypothetical protein